MLFNVFSPSKEDVRENLLNQVWDTITAKRTEIVNSEEFRNFDENFKSTDERALELQEAIREQEVAMYESAMTYISLKKKLGHNTDKEAIQTSKGMLLLPNHYEWTADGRQKEAKSLRGLLQDYVYDAKREKFSSYYSSPGWSSVRYAVDNYLDKKKAPSKKESVAVKAILKELNFDA
jgi:hypothetical protein